MALLTPFTAVFSYALQPVAPFSWFGLGVSTLDVVAAVRLCLVLRQIREILQRQHTATKGHSTVEEKSFVKNLATTLMVVYGGEAITAPMLGSPPSFMLSGTIPAVFTLAQFFVDQIPSVPEPSFVNEMPLVVVDGFTRAFLLCTLIPPLVITNTSQTIASSPWTLLVTSLFTANAGFFFINMLSFLHPTSMTLRTPPELQAYGWTAVDLWCAPFITGLYALLTHAQPFWADLHAMLLDILGGSLHLNVGSKGLAGAGTRTVEPLDPDSARAICALVLCALFSGRTVKNFRTQAEQFWKRLKHGQSTGEKTKTQ